MSLGKIVFGALLALGGLGLTSEPVQAQYYNHGHGGYHSYNHSFGPRYYSPAPYYAPRVYVSPYVYPSYGSYYSPSYYPRSYGSGNSYGFGYNSSPFGSSFGFSFGRSNYR